jgi:hypothetical protein
MKNRKSIPLEQKSRMRVTMDTSNDVAGKERKMFEESVDPWEVKESDFPAQGSAEEQLRFLLRYAVLAPSRHNTQPWRFRVVGHTVELFADRERRLAAVDPDDRELTISCGAALANLLLAMRAFGFAQDVDLEVHAEHPDLLARVRLEIGEPASEEEHQLFSTITKRRTNRHLFTEREVPATLLFALEDMATRQGISFQVVPEVSRSALVDLIIAADHDLWANAQYREELAAWTRARARHGQADSRDGVPEEALGQADLAASLGSPVLHTLTQKASPRSRGIEAGSPVMAVISTFADSQFDWLAAGWTLEYILLRARTAGVWVSFFNQPIEVPAYRAKLRTLLGRRDDPQLVLRLGYGSDVPPTPRRGVSEVLMNKPGESGEEER